MTRLGNNISEHPNFLLTHTLQNFPTPTRGVSKDQSSIHMSIFAIRTAIVTQFIPLIPFFPPSHSIKYDTEKSAEKGEFITVFW